MFKDNFDMRAFKGVFKNYAWRNAPWIWATLWLGESFGIFKAHEQYQGLPQSTNIPLYYNL